MIDDIWKWGAIEELAPASIQTHTGKLDQALGSACVFGGAWLSHVASGLVANGINVAELCYDMWYSLQQGRSEATLVIVLAGASGGEGKSVLLKPLHNIFKDRVFNVTKEAGNFPLPESMGCQIAFLDEYRFDPDVISWATQCLWFDGSAASVGKPQDVRGMTGNMTYTGSAPIFITTKLEDLKELEYHAQIYSCTSVPWNADASMLLRRLKCYKFFCRAPMPRGKMEFCAHCFANPVQTHAAGRAATRS